jgi:lipopolysaccharide/colanic/teichoic acid biosynthesis glycosyltransferase
MSAPRTQVRDRIAAHDPLSQRAPAEADAIGPAARESLAERYKQMAHEGHEHRGVDTALRGLDLGIAGVSLVVLSPVLATIAISIRLTSGGPILYRGRRVGRAGRIFTMLKFRTLTPDAEARLGPYLGEELTQRTRTEVTRLGRVLRFAHLDELPQLWNVLRGDMSIVGPRPIRPAFFEELCEQIPQYWQRLVVEPGLTGFAQLRMTRETSWAEKLAHDLEYVADRSVHLYLRVCVATAWKILSSPWRATARLLSRPAA